MDRSNIIRLPKLDLHCHLDGSLSKSFLEKTLVRPLKDEDLSADMDCNSLEEYLKKFDIPLEALSTKENIKNAAIDVIKTAYLDGVRYIEVRFAPLLSVSTDLDTRAVIEAVLDGLREGEKIYGVYSNALCAAMTHHSTEESCAMFDIAREYYHAGVAGVDLAGDEASHPIEEFSELFAYARKLGMDFTVHAGEAGPKSNIEGAIDYGAKRIGHGIAMRHDTRLLDMAAEKRIGIEMCPTSNYQTKALSLYEAYPYTDYLNRGLLATVNTDNRTVSTTSITDEFVFLQNKGMISDADILQGIKNAIEVSFASDDIKDALWKELENEKI